MWMRFRGGGGGAECGGWGGAGWVDACVWVMGEERVWKCLGVALGDEMIAL